jgi:Cd2+/Zn2+-exporting ATPase
MDCLPESNTNSTVFVIPAMDCPEELRLIEKGLRSLDGIDGLRPDYLNRSLRVDFDQSRVGVEAIADQLHRIGFTPSNAQFDQADPRANWLQFSPIRLTTIGGALLLLAAGLLSAAVYYWSWPYFPWVPFLAIASTVLSGWHVAVAAWRAVALRHLNMHVLMCIAASGAIAIGEWFEAATAMLLFGVSLWLEEFSRGRARKAVESLVALMPKMAHRVGTEHACGHEHREGHECEHVVADIPLDAVRMGDRILIKPGERVPVDGTVLDGASAVNQAPLTGESVPVDKSTGDELYAGSLNGEGSLQMRATSTSADSSMAQISRLVEQAQAAKSPTERFVDQFARWYTPAVIGLAFGIAFIPLLLGWKADANVGATWYHDARNGLAADWSCWWSPVPVPW